MNVSISHCQRLRRRNPACYIAGRSDRSYAIVLGNKTLKSNNAKRLRFWHYRRKIQQYGFSIISTVSPICLQGYNKYIVQVQVQVLCVAMPSLMSARWVGQNSGLIFRRFWTKVGYAELSLPVREYPQFSTPFTD